MNPQPPQEIATLVSVVVICMIAYYAIKAHLETVSGSQLHKVNHDLFAIGQIEEPSPPVVIVNAPSTTKSKINFESMQLYQDCIDTLVAIGYKKTEAKKRAKSVFTKHIPKSVQEFLNIILKAP